MHQLTDDIQATQSLGGCPALAINQDSMVAQLRSQGSDRNSLHDGTMMRSQERWSSRRSLSRHVLSWERGIQALDVLDSIWKHAGMTRGARGQLRNPGSDGVTEGERQQQFSSIVIGHEPPDHRSPGDRAPEHHCVVTLSDSATLEMNALLRRRAVVKEPTCAVGSRCATQCDRHHVFFRGSG